MRWFALELNPLAAVLGRYSFNAELMTGQHLALIANPFVRYANDGTVTVSTSPEVVAGGSELGFRYYTGHDGPRGFFIGPSLIVESVSHRGGPKSAPVGFAADLGGQWVSQGGFIISGGAGLATIYDFPDIEATAFPRVLFSLGQAL